MTPEEKRYKLSTAKAQVESVREAYLTEGNIDGARTLNEIVHLLDDEIAALNRSANDNGG